MFIKTFVCHKQRYYNSKHARTSEIRRQENGSNESMYQLGSVRSAIRELFEYGKKRAAIVGKENVYDLDVYKRQSINYPQMLPWLILYFSEEYTAC